MAEAASNLWIRLLTSSAKAIMIGGGQVGSLERKTLGGGVVLIRSSN